MLCLGITIDVRPKTPAWVPAWMATQVEALEAAAHPGLTSEVPLSTREFLELEVATTEEDVQAHGATRAETSGDGGVGVCGGGGERLVIYPARNGHASYHKPKRCEFLTWWYAEAKTGADDAYGLPTRKDQRVAAQYFTIIPQTC